MVITWYGQSCFRVQSGAAVLVFDPFEKTIGLSPPMGESQIVLISHAHSDHNNIKSLKGDPFIVDSPGEYEYQGIRIRGARSFHDSEKGKKEGLNTMYSVVLEGINLVHLGDLGQKGLTDKQIDALGGVDILLVPVGGKTTLDAKGAVEVINQIEPKITIPMHYAIKGLKSKIEKVEPFLNEIGQKEVKPQEKLVIKQKDLPQERMEVFVLKV
ncbi:MAG: MBL fold metallo-hydrolase [Candidatus Spechtbacterales bacterium]